MPCGTADGYELKSGFDMTFFLEIMSENIPMVIRIRYLKFLGGLAGFWQCQAQGWEEFHPAGWSLCHCIQVSLQEPHHCGCGCPCAGQSRLNREAQGTVMAQLSEKGGTTSRPRASWFQSSLNSLALSGPIPMELFQELNILCIG